MVQKGTLEYHVQSLFSYYRSNSFVLSFSLKSIPITSKPEYKQLYSLFPQIPIIRFGLGGKLVPDVGCNAVTI